MLGEGRTVIYCSLNGARRNKDLQTLVIELPWPDSTGDWAV